MRKHCAENVAIKREYFDWLRNAEGRDEATVDMVAAAIHRFEAFTRHANFKTFRHERASSYKAHLAAQVNPKTGKPLSKATLHSHCSALQAFFQWLAREPGYRRAIRHSDAAYFKLSANDTRIATARRERRAPSLAQALRVLETMPSETVIQRRDRAVVAFILLTGVRDSAAASLRLGHVDLTTGEVRQDARTVRTKRAKTFTSNFFPVGDPPRQIVTDWIGELTSERLFGPDDPLFPASVVGLNPEGRFGAQGLSRAHWTSASPIRSIFQKAFATAGQENHGPHSLRRTLMRLAYDLKLAPKELKAWSQSLGHDSALTTLTSYGHLPAEEQSKVMAELANPRPEVAKTAEEILEAVAAMLAKA